MAEYTLISSIEHILFIKLVQLILRYYSDMTNSSVSSSWRSRKWELTIEPRPETQIEMLMTSPHSIDTSFAIHVCQSPFPSRVESGLSCHELANHLCYFSTLWNIRKKGNDLHLH